MPGAFYVSRLKISRRVIVILLLMVIVILLLCGFLASPKRRKIKKILSFQWSLASEDRKDAQEKAPNSDRGKVPLDIFGNVRTRKNQMEIIMSLERQRRFRRFFTRIQESKAVKVT